MAESLWGQLQKAQDDEQTIDEAIAAAISAHEADADSHLGSGESLEQHKAEEVIDHPQGSVLADKQTFTEISVQTIFESLDGWSTLGTVDNDDIPGIGLYIEDGAVEESNISTSPVVPLNFRYSSVDMLFQMLAHFNLSTSSFNANFGYFSNRNITPTGFGFIIDAGVLYAYAKEGANIEQSSAISLDLSADHVYRVFLDADLQQIFFFVDGTLVATLDVPGSGWEDDQGPRIWIANVSGNDGYLRVGNLAFSRGL